MYIIIILNNKKNKKKNPRNSLYHLPKEKTVCPYQNPCKILNTHEISSDCSYKLNKLKQLQRTFYDMAQTQIEMNFEFLGKI